MIEAIFRKTRSDKCGFTMSELLLATLILLPVLVSVMYMFLKCMELNKLARHSSQAVLEVRDRIASIENTDFTQIVNDFDEVTFVTGDLDGIGVSYVDDSQPNILEVTAAFCWREKNGRIIGEDTDLDGTIDAGEDLNGNGIIDSPVMISMAIHNS